MLDLKQKDKLTNCCLMTCFLDYQKLPDGKTENFKGTFNSKDQSNGNECSFGTVYLKLVRASVFENEKLVLKRENKVNKYRNQY